MTPQEIDIALSKAKNATGLSAFEDSAIHSVVLRRKRDGDRVVLMPWQVELLTRIVERLDRANAASGL